MNRKPSKVVMFATSAIVYTAIASAAYAFPTSFDIDVSHDAGTTLSFAGTVRDTDTLSFTVTGLTYVQFSCCAGINAAGVVAAMPPWDHPIGTAWVPFPPGATDGYPGTYVGSLLVGLDGVGPQQVLLPSPATGLGSASPPTTFVVDTALATLVGAFGTLTNPDFHFLVSDNFGGYGDNIGVLTITGLTLTQQQTDVPEPAGVAVLAVGLASLILRHRRRT